MTRMERLPVRGNVSSPQADRDFPHTLAPADCQGDRSSTGRRAVRVAVICDFREENWPSMDLVGDMLYRYLDRDQGNGITPTQVQPALRRRLMRVPISRQLGWNVDRLINRFGDYPLWMRREYRRFDVFHVVDHSYSQLIHNLPRGRTVVTCHDLDTFRCLLEPRRDMRPAWFRAMTRRILNGFRLAAHVITVSSAIREELLGYGLFSPERISVIPNGVHPACSPFPDPLADAQVARFLISDYRRPI